MTQLIIISIYLCLLLGLSGAPVRERANGRSGRVGASRAWMLAVAVSWAALAMALLLLWQVLGSGGPSTVMLGGWAAP